MAVSPAEIEFALNELRQKHYSPADFFYGFLTAHDAPRSAVSKIKATTSDDATELVWPRKLHFKHVSGETTQDALESLKSGYAQQKTAPRFLLTCDGSFISGYDRSVDEYWHVEFEKLNNRFNMTLPLAGLERFKPAEESPADVKASGRLAKFYDAVLDANPTWSGLTHRHELNLFITRVLFCMFAEDTGILPEDIFTATVAEKTKIDGSDVATVLTNVFSALDLKTDDRIGLPSYVDDFPYVNGGLFREKTAVPSFSKRARALLLDACNLGWAEINPDIFGSMIQGVVDDDKRSQLGMHYTSVPNILKVLDPLFLNDLRAEFDQAGDNVKKLERLLWKMARIRVFDPACGSGNFLIIAYRELRRLENAIFKKLQSLAVQSILPMSQIRLSQFYGIEYADFATETAKLSLWIAEYQANREFEAEFGRAPAALPLKDGGNIVHGNAARVDWLTVCPPDETSLTFIVGNPPYLGGTTLKPEQKQDMALVFSSLRGAYKYLDYVSCWFLKAADFIRVTGAECAFVSTNSICQGEQVSLLWPLLYERGMEISFAHTSFKWRNNASKNAAVTCVIIGLANAGSRKKLIYDEDTVRVAENINPYLMDFENILVRPSTRPLNGLVPIDNGNKPTDGGHLFLDADEKMALVSEYPAAADFLRRAYGAHEYINGVERWCLWIPDDKVEDADRIPPIARRISKVRDFRLESPKAPTRQRAEVAHKFDQVRHRDVELIIVPRHFSENRHYLTIGVLDGQRSVVTDACFAIYEAPLLVFAIMSSRLHTAWTAGVGGRIKTDYRYSNTLVYNTFPVPDLSKRQVELLEECAWRIIECREHEIGKSMAELYNPEVMPPALLEAHQNLDRTIETIYRGRSFKNDDERIRFLLKLYDTRSRKGDMHG